MVKVGDSIETLSPMGDFIYERLNDKSVYLWGVGSGITPLISLAKQILFDREHVKIKLVYGNRTEESTIFLNQIRSLKEKYPERFFPIHFFTQATIEPHNPLVVYGRIDSDKAKSIIIADEDLKHTSHFICGPTGLKKSVTDALLSENVDEAAIFTEDFELILKASVMKLRLLLAKAF
jgi:ring-1,2-phenylacetyl-CoA epoxidase subunit PaaE